MLYFFKSEYFLPVCNTLFHLFLFLGAPKQEETSKSTNIENTDQNIVSIALIF